jgi:hypothetical protein
LKYNKAKNKLCIAIDSYDLIQRLVGVVDRVYEKLIDLFKQLSRQPRVWNMTLSASLVYQEAVRNAIVEYYGINSMLEVHIQGRRRGECVKARE